MEVYRGEVQRIQHTVLISGEVTEPDDSVFYEIVDDDGGVVDFGEADQALDSDDNPKPGVYTTNIGTDITDADDHYTIIWSYEIESSYVERREPLQVVTPIMTYEHYLETYQKSHEVLEYRDFKLLEMTVRKVIESYCNQSFNLESNLSYSIQGDDSDSLMLRRRIVSLDSVQVLDPHVNSAGDETPYDITEYVTFDDDDRWSIRRLTSGGIERNFSPIYRSQFFRYPKMYKVTGTWGWERIPEDIYHAAGILINDYQCADAKYREKYIDNIRAADWRMEFKLTGSETTGNANADMILSEYRNVGLVVI